MACVDDKGRLTKSAIKLLTAIQTEPLTPEEISNQISIPLFKVRSSIRDMKNMGFVIKKNGAYLLNPQAEKLLNRDNDS